MKGFKRKRSTPFPVRKIAIALKSNTPTSFLKRHNKLVLMFGASIVLFTFIVRDVLGERFREIDASIGAAETFFSVRAQIRKTNDRIHRVQERIESIIFDVDRGENVIGAGRGRYDIYYNRDVVIREAVEDDQDTLDRVAPLLDVLHDSNNMIFKYLQRKATYDKANAEVTIKFQELVIQHLPVPKKLIQQGNAIHNSLYVKPIPDAPNTSEFAEQVLKEAEKQEQIAERRSRHFTLASYVLYAIGWGLTLSGRLFGIDSLVASTD